MAKKRTELSPILRSILGSNNVYFQSPAPHKLTYPCIVYEISSRNVNYADNTRYKDMNQYTVTLIGKDPDNDEYIDQLLDLPYCSFDRRFVSDNLYHDVFNLFF